MSLPLRLCPFCASEDVTTTGNGPPELAYWRCRRCGELWNPARTQVRPRGHDYWRP